MNIKVAHKLFIRSNHWKEKEESIWFIHGFADSGLAYKEAFESVLDEHFNLFVVDMPGFGVSPLNPGYLGLKEQAALLSTVIQEESPSTTRVNIVAHSLGGLLGTWICQEITSRINCFISVEGNLTEADGYFSSKPLDYDTAEEFATSFEEEIFQKAQQAETYRRYYSSLRLAEPEAMRNWSLSSQSFTQDNKCGIEFRELTCKKIYLWGERDTPVESIQFLKDNQIANHQYDGIGHWHMVENARVFYRDIFHFIKKGSI
ncbi:MAG: alpha/beta hydrolase [Bacteroidia bacterium]|nr:alpha/beta hydrolase [Bacteroidia bacterium]